MQSLLAQLYDAPSGYDIYDYLTTDRRHLNLPPHCTDEQVLIADDGEGPRLGVFIDQAVLARLAHRDPLSRITDENLADYCTAFEGVSHFQYLTWRIAHNLPVSLLELELQAEVDKYVAAVLLLMRQDGRHPVDLHRRLFDRVGFAAELDEETLHRYRLANRHAARYCRKLDERYLRVRRQRMDAWMAELRRFYRYGHAEKVRRAGEH